MPLLSLQVKKMSQGHLLIWLKHSLFVFEIVVDYYYHYHYHSSMDMLAAAAVAVMKTT